MKSGFILDSGETLQMEIEAELWATSSNPIAMFIGSIKKLIGGILGFKRVGFLIVTNKRVVEVIQFKALYIFNTGRNMKMLMPSSIKEVGYKKDGTILGCFCQSYKLYYQGFTEFQEILLTSISTDAEAQKIADSFYKAIAATQQAAE